VDVGLPRNPLSSESWRRQSRSCSLTTERFALAAPASLSPEAARALMLVAERRGPSSPSCGGRFGDDGALGGAPQATGVSGIGESEGVETLLSRLSKQQVIGLATAGVADAIVPGANLNPRRSGVARWLRR